jgi:hypothetical protein
MIDLASRHARVPETRAAASLLKAGRPVSALLRLAPATTRPHASEEAAMSVDDEIWDAYEHGDYVSTERAQDLGRRLLAEEGSDTWLHICRAKWVGAACPRCNATGEFRSRFMGRLKHPGCGHTWYLNPGRYLLHQMKLAFHAGAGAGTSASSDAERRGGGGTGAGIVGFIIGGLARLALGICLVPIQAIVFLASGASRSSGGAEPETK